MQTPGTGLRHSSSDHCHYDYGIGLEKPSANGHFFVSIQIRMSVRLLTADKLLIVVFSFKEFYLFLFFVCFSFWCNLLTQVLAG